MSSQNRAAELREVAGKGREGGKEGEKGELRMTQTGVARK